MQSRAAINILQIDGLKHNELLFKTKQSPAEIHEVKDFLNNFSAWIDIENFILQQHIKTLLKDVARNITYLVTKKEK